MQAAQTYSEGNGTFYYEVPKFGHWGRSYPADVSDATMLGLSTDDMMNLALLTNGK